MSVVARTRNGGETEGLGDILPRLTCFAAWKDNGYYVVRYPGGATSSCPSPRRRTPATTPVTPATQGMTRFRSTSSKVSNLENRERPPPPYLHIQPYLISEREVTSSLKLRGDGRGNVGDWFQF